MLVTTHRIRPVIFTGIRCCLATALLSLWLGAALAVPIESQPSAQIFEPARLAPLFPPPESVLQDPMGIDAALYRGQWNRALEQAATAITGGSRDIPILGTFAIAAAVLGNSQIVDRALPQLRTYEQQPYYSALVQSIVELKQGASESAEKRLSALLERHPGDPLALYFRGELENLRGEQAQALKSFQAVLEKAPEFAPALAAKARLLPQEQAEEAVRLMGQALEIHPENAAYRRRLADLYAKAGRQEEANQIYKKLLKSVPGVKEHNLAGAWQLLQSGRDREALKQVDKVFENWGPQPLGHLIRAMAAIDLGESTGVDKALADYLSASKQSPHSHFAAGLCSLARGQNSRAGQHFQTTLEHQPSNVQAQTNLAVVAQLTGDLGKAGTALKQAASAGENPDLVSFLKASQALTEGEIEGYRQSLGNADALLPGSRNLQLNLPQLKPQQRHQIADNHNLMLVMFLNKWYSQAIRFADLALQAVPGDAIALYFRTLALEAQGRFRQALATAELAAAGEPRFIGAHMALARLKARTADPRSALAAYQSLVALAPDSVPAHLGLANTLLALGRKDDALQALAQGEAVALKGHTLFQLALGYQRAGDQTKSRGLLKRALEMDGSGPWRIQAAQYLNRLEPSSSTTPIAD